MHNRHLTSSQIDPSVRFFKKRVKCVTSSVQKVIYPSPRVAHMSGACRNVGVRNDLFDTSSTLSALCESKP
jgi:hypothetical protein